MRKLARVLALVAIGIALAPQARAQEAYPSRLVKIVVPAAPGSTTDALARIVADGLSQTWGRSVIVENIAGGAMNVGAVSVARAAPDGYTLMVGYVGTHGTNPAVRKLPYDAVKDFTPIAMVGGTPNILVVPPSLPVKTLSEFIAYAKANKDKLSYGSSGPGTLTHLAMEQLKVATDIDLAHAAYRGIAETARSLAIEMAQSRTSDPNVAYTVGEMENQLVTAQLAHVSLIELATSSLPGPETTSAALIRRTILANAVMRTVEKAMEVAGGVAFYRSTPLERLFRDIQGARFHRPQERAQLRLTGRLMLGLEMDE